MDAQAKSGRPNEAVRTRTLITLILGFWMMVAPTVLGSVGDMAKSSVIAGFLTVIASAASYFSIIPPARFLNVLFGAWFVVGQWFISGAIQPKAHWIAFFIGVVMVLLNVPWERRERKELQRTTRT